MKYLIWHITHGVETGLENDYAAKHIELVRKYIDSSYLDYIVPHATNWSEVVEDRQRKTWEMENELALSSFRKTCVEIACDLLWYRSSKQSAGKFDVFSRIHGKLEFELELLLDKYGADAGIVREGHSLGSQIMLDACFESKQHTTGLITIGSPISKYSGMYPDWGHLPEKELRWWINLYANRDLVASEFRKHPSEQIRSFVEDYRVKSFNPLNWPILKAHTFYWKDDFVCKTIAKRLVNHLLWLNNQG
jgi:hypothetical protein